jgi:hypothetical protein
MTTTEAPTLRQKLDALIQGHTGKGMGPIQVSLSYLELQSLVEMLREDEPPDTTGTMPGLYSVTLSPPGVDANIFFSVTGEGIHNRHDVPAFKREADAESMCRCLSLAYRAGQRQRSRALMRLLDED